MNHFAAWGEPCSTEQTHVRCEVCGEHCNRADHNHLHPEIVKWEGRIKISFCTIPLSTLYIILVPQVCVDLDFNIASPLHTLWRPRQVSSALLLYCLVQCPPCTLWSPSQVPAKILTKQIICCSCQARGGAGWLRTGRDVRMTIASHSGSILCPPAQHQLSRPSLLLFKSETLNCSWIATWILWPGWVPV